MNNKLKNFLYKLFYEKTWVIGYRELKDNKDLPITEKKVQYKVKMPTCRYWYADPFIVEDQGKLFVFCEAMDLLCGKGRIGVAEINDGEMSSFKIVNKLSCHTSYPCVFKYENEYYMIPETSHRLSIELYRAVSFPDKWILDTILMKNITAVDSTVISHNNQISLITYDNKSLILAFFNLNMELRRLEPLKIDYIEDPENRLRPAGSLLKINEHWIRPSQDCRKKYGEKIFFNKITDLFETAYKENSIGNLSINNISTDKSTRFTRAHTFNRAGNYEVIDLYFEKFMLWRPVMAVIRKICSSRG